MHCDEVALGSRIVDLDDPCEVPQYSPRAARNRMMSEAKASVVKLSHPVMGITDKRKTSSRRPVTAVLEYYDISFERHPQLKSAGKK